MHARPFCQRRRALRWSARLRDAQQDVPPRLTVTAYSFFNTQLRPILSSFGSHCVVKPSSGSRRCFCALPGSSGGTGRSASVRRLASSLRCRRQLPSMRCCNSPLRPPANSDRDRDRTPFRVWQLRRTHWGGVHCSLLREVGTPDASIGFVPECNTKILGSCARQRLRYHWAQWPHATRASASVCTQHIGMVLIQVLSHPTLSQVLESGHADRKA